MIMPKITVDETGDITKVEGTGWEISRVGMVSVLSYVSKFTDIIELTFTITQIGDSEGMPPPDWDGIHLMLAVALDRVYTTTYPINYETDDALNASLNEGIKKLWDQTPYK